MVFFLIHFIFSLHNNISTKMSHKTTPYTLNCPANQEFGSPSETEKAKDETPKSGYPSPQASPGPPASPGPSFGQASPPGTTPGTPRDRRPYPGSPGHPRFPDISPKISHKTTSPEFGPPSETEKAKDETPKSGYSSPQASPSPPASPGPSFGPSSPPGTPPGTPPGPLPYPGSPGHPRFPGGWMSMPTGITNCPPGLEYLSTLDQVLVAQKIDMLEMFLPIDIRNKYAVMNNAGQMIYYAAEYSDLCQRYSYGNWRAFHMQILDSAYNEVIHLDRPCACTGSCCPCCLQFMEVSAPPGIVIGSIEEVWSCCLPRFLVKNAAGDVVLLIKGPFCVCGLGTNVDFDVCSVDGQYVVGKISKKWSGAFQEFFTNADNFGISFPMDLDVRTKAVLLGACLLIVRQNNQIRMQHRYKIESSLNFIGAGYEVLA